MKTRVEVRSDSVFIDGYVNAVERESKVLQDNRGKFKEVIKQGCFKRALESTDNVDVLLNHDNNRKLTSTAEGFELYEDNIGLRAIGTITDKEVVEKARNNKLVGWSFGFYPTKENYEELSDGIEKRSVSEMVLKEVSILDSTKIPAYNATSIEYRDGETKRFEVRSVADEVKTIVIDEKPNFDNSKYKERIEALRR